MKIPDHIEKRIAAIDGELTRKRVRECFMAYREDDDALLDHCLFFVGMEAGGELLRKEIKALNEIISSYTS